MHRALACCLLFLIALASPAAAGDPLDTELANLRTAVREDRVAVVRDALALSAEQAAVFWPLYLEHQEALDAVRDQRLALVLDFFEKAKTMSDDEAKAMLLRALDAKRAMIDVDRAHAEKMLESLPPRTVARYFQIENKIDALINMELASIVPLTPTEAARPEAAAPATTPATTKP